MLKYDWATQPEDIAQAIWDAVKNQRAEVTVGPAFLVGIRSLLVVPRFDAVGNGKGQQKNRQDACSTKTEFFLWNGHLARY
ncbi:hypothetical protein [Microcoleus asticus]|nr:hypothetical protein [Microcoleus asticus]